MRVIFLLSYLTTKLLAFKPILIFSKSLPRAEKLHLQLIRIRPSCHISATAIATNGLMNCKGDLMYHGVKVQSVPMRLVLVSFTERLGLFKKMLHCCT
jgi:hypothetical protein